MQHCCIKMKKFILSYCWVALAFLGGCKPDDPQAENIPELITKVVLRFTPTNGSAKIVTASDPDGEGVLDMVVDGPIELTTATTYTLELELVNELYSSAETGYRVSDQIKAEADEHQFFFSWSGDAFATPTGNGNIDNRSDPVNYLDKDDHNLPLGLVTSWTTSGSVTSKDFRILLKHQPGVKSGTSTAHEGESDLDITFTLDVN